MRVRLDLDNVSVTQRLEIIEWFVDIWGDCNEYTWDINIESCGGNAIDAFVDIYIMSEQILTMFILRWGQDAILQQEA